MVNTGRAYSDPSPAFVRGATKSGVTDPELLVEKNWTPDQKRKWIAQFNLLLGHSERIAAEDVSKEREREIKALDVAQNKIPVLRDVREGLGQGLADLGGLGLRAGGVLGPAPKAGQDQLADVANRQAEEREKVYGLVDKSGPAPALTSGLRGSVRSVTSAGVLGPLGSPAVIGGFAASRANQAATEAKDAGLTGREAAGYVGRAALIEGGVAGAFQLAGAGGMEKLVAGGVTRAGVKEFLKSVGHELVEENVTEVLDAYNQAKSGITGPVTNAQLAEILKQTTIQTLMTMGLAKGVQVAQGDQRSRLAGGIAEQYGWSEELARELIGRAEKRPGDFEVNLGAELLTEQRLKPQSLAFWAAENMGAARDLLASEAPSRKAWAEAGLPRTTEEGRATAVASLRKVMQILDAPPEVAEASPAEPTPAPPTSLPAQDAEATAEGPPAAVVQDTEEGGSAEAVVTTPPATPATPDWRTADAATLRGLVEGFQVPEEEHQEAAARLSQLENPVPEGADWKTADAETLRSMILAKAVGEEDMPAAQERLVALHEELVAPKVEEAPPPPVAKKPKKRTGLKAETKAIEPGITATVITPPPLEPVEAPPAPAVEPTDEERERLSRLWRKFRPELEKAIQAKRPKLKDYEGVAVGQRASANVMALIGKNPTDEEVRAAVLSALEPVAPEGFLETPATPRTKTGGTVALSVALASRLRKGEATDWRTLKELADVNFGGTLGEGAYELQDAYEAVELALSDVGARDARVNLEKAQDVVTELGELLEAVPTQTTRSGGKIALQQFSTPTDYAFAAAWAANLREGDVVLEPSAGTGNLVAHAKASGARVIANEIDTRRAELVKTIADEVYSEDAKQIADILGPKGVKPTVVIMNPPFSADKNRKGKRNLMEAAQHIEAALALLPEGGRLVAIVGRGMSEDSATFAGWWDKIGGTHHVRANVEVSGDVYAKMGTSFGTRLLVIDKTLPDAPGPVVTGSVNTVAELLAKLEEVRNGRPRAADRQAVSGAAPGPGGAVAGVAADGPPVSPPDRGGGHVAADQPASAAEGVPRGDAAPSAAGDASGLPAGRRGSRAGSRKRAGQAADAPAGPPARGNAGEGAQLPAAVAPAVEGLAVSAADRTVGEDQGTYEGYAPATKVRGAKPHPTPLVESAAMASVEAPKVTYSPKIDQKLIDEGVVSDAQLEPVIYAGAAHEQTIVMPATEQDEFTKLSGKPAPKEKRRGYFVGDGTGVGKGRIAAAVILDNMNRGRKKAIWISEGRKLFQAAIRDWTALGGAKKDLKGLHQVAAGEAVNHGDGILFGTYTTLGKEAPDAKEGQAKRLARIEQIAQWAGPDFDGVLVFDESHNAANATDAKGARGVKKASLMALATVELQRRLPNARVLYMSATGATQVSNLAYADRLGLWGEGTEFANREAFLNSVAAGGVAAMELVARDMKAQGMYGSRTLSFKGVDYSRLTHALEPDQVRMYDDLCEAWQVVLRDIGKALELTGPDGKVDATQKRNAMGQFWGSQQRFFNQVLTALQMPSVLKALREDIAAGKAPVVQIVNTMEAATDRALKKAKADAAEAGEEEDLADVDLTPREALIELVTNAFPITKYEVYEDENGNKRSRPVEDSEGNAVVSQEAVKLRDALIDKLQDVRVPEAPIDQIINEFGHKRVAEVTGRGRRVVKTKNNEKEEQKRSTAGVLEDIRAFMDGERDLLVFSQAGATGESYHADLTRKNQKQRRHYVLQAGWRADKAVQGLGRSHRSNQANTPEFRLVETNLPGHRRFISTIAKRLEQLGALTRGQRTAGGGGLFSEADNLEGTHAQDALYAFLMDVIEGKVEGVLVSDFEEQTGLKLLGDENSSSGVRSIQVKQFLNRLLSLKVDMQDKVFNAYADKLATAVEAARQNGTLDVGMETIRATRIEKVSEQVVRRDKASGAATKHVELKTFVPIVRHDFDAVLERLRGKKKDSEVGFWRNHKTGRIYLVASAGTTTTAKGKIVDLAVRWGPAGRIVVETDKLYSTHGWVGSEDEARADWNEALANLPDEEEKRVHLITGALLPVWNSITGKPRVRRATTDKGERFLGRVVEEDDISDVLTNLGVERTFVVPEAKEAHALLMGGGTLVFANGWTIKRRQIQSEPHFEIDGLRYGDGQLVTDMGGRRDVKAGRARYFIPTGEGFAAIYDRLVKVYQLVKVHRPGSEERQLAPSDDGPDRPGGGGGLRVLPGGASEAPERPLQKVEVIGAIERLYPGLSIRGPATFRRQFKIERARGWYTPALGEARLRERYDVITAIHELGHHFDRELGNWSRQAGHTPGVGAELMQLGKDLYGDRAPAGGYRSEGFAEFIREYLSGSSDLQSRAPTLYLWFTTEFLAENPKEAARVNELGGLVQRLLAQTPQQNVEAFMAPTRRDWSAERIAAKLGEAEANWRDSNLPLLRGMQGTGADLSKIEPRQHPYMLATFYARSAGGRAKHAALAQTVDLWGRENGKGLRDVLAPVVDQGEEAFKAWKEFMVASRALDRYHAHGINPGLSEADARAIVAKNENRPHFQATAEAFTDFAHRALEPLVQSGAMTQKEFDDIREWNPIYVPFLRRVESEGDVAGKAGGARGRAVNRVTKAGSNLPIHDPIDAMLLQYEKIQQVAMQADVVRALVRFYDTQKGEGVKALGRFLTEEPVPTEATTFSAEQIRSKVLAAAGEKADDVEEALETFWDERLTVFTPGTKPGGRRAKNVISVVIDGKRRNFEVQPGLMPIVEGITRTTFLPGTLGAIVRGATQLQRLGATGLNPAFGLVRNALRDTLTAAITGDYHFHVPVISTIRGMWRHLQNSDYARRYHAAGLDISQQLGQDIQAARGLSKAMGAPGAIGSVVRPKLPPGLRDVAFSLDGLREVLGASEVGPRLMEFEAAHQAAMAKWGDDRDATIVAGAASKDVTVNFARAGNTARKVNEVVLFFNAAVQSADKLLRSVGALEAAPWASTEDRRANATRTLAKGAGFLTATALLLYLLQNRGDPEWEELPPHEKWGYFHVRIPGGGFMRIPLPFEAGSVFGALPIALLEGPDALAEALRVAGKSATPIDLDGMHGIMRNVALLGPIADVLANEDWKGAPIVPDSVGDNRVPSDQYGPNVTRLARFLGAHAPGGGVSPAKLEHLLDNYTGGLYRRLMGAVDTALDPSAVQPLNDPSTLPIMGTLFLRPGTSRVVHDFYDRLKHLRRRQGSKISTLEELGELARAERVNEELQETWKKRRTSIASDSSAATVRAETEALMREAQAKIREHGKREKATDRRAGLGALLYRQTDPRATQEPLPEGITEAEAVAALREEGLRRAEGTIRAARRHGQKARPAFEYVRARDAQGDLTAFGKRQAILLRRLRAR